MSTKCVIYRRYSSDEQGRGEGETLSTQLQACEAYAARRGWAVIDILTDEGFSAYKGEHLQPGAALFRFVEQVKAGEVERGTVLLAWKQNRVSRLNLDETMVWIYGLTSRGIGIAFADSERVYEANPSVEDYLGMAIRAATANRESKDKSDNVRAAKRTLWGKAERKEGKWTNLSARPPLWLSRNVARNDWIIDAHRAALIRDIYQWSADGMGAVLITNRLNEMGEPPWGKWRRYDDGKWGRSAVRALLNNPAVEGDLVPEQGMFEGRVLHDFYPRIVDADLVSKARGQHVARAKRSGQWKGEVQKPLEKRENRKIAVRQSRAFSNLFVGVMFCGECDKRAFMSSSVSKGRLYSYIRCEGAGDGRCANRDYYAYREFERTALDLCLDLAMDDRFFEATGELREAQRRKAELEKAIADTRRKRKLWMDRHEEDQNDRDVIERMDSLKADLARLTGELAEVEAAVETASGKVNAVEHLRRVADIREAAKSEDKAVREQARGKLKLALSAIVNHVEIVRTAEGLKVFRVALLGGVVAIQIDTEGRVVDDIDQVGGRPLYEYLSAEHRAMAEPLIRRLREHRGLYDQPLDPLVGNGPYTFLPDQDMGHG
jgi:hypothetical protein